LTLPRDANATSPTLTTQAASEMTDRDDDLRATIEHLHELLDGVDDVDPQARQLLAGALGEIRDKLGTDQTGDTQEQNDSGRRESVIEQLTEAAKHFDDEHPTLAGMIGSVIDTLGRMGI
jgi:hypothetical protein